MTTYTRCALKLSLAAVAVCLLLGVTAPSALADFGIQSFQITAQDDHGNPVTQAGSHPNVTVSLAFNSHPVSCVQGPIGSPVEGTCPAPDGPTKDVEVNLPPGLIGNPNATPQCDVSHLTDGTGGQPTCPADTVVGVVTVGGAFNENNHTVPNQDTATVPIFNLTPPADEPALFAFSIGQIVTYIDASVRTGGDYGLTTTTPNIDGVGSSGAAKIDVTFWGVPADHNGPGPITLSAADDDVISSLGGPSGGTRLPFLSYPTDCESGPLTATLSADSWANEGQYVSASSTLPEPTGCDGLGFSPTLTVAPDSTQAGEPAGYTVDLNVPQSDSPDGLATPELENATVTLPAGVVVSPSEADGLQGCSDQQFAVSVNAPASCPDGSDIGTVQVTTPLLSAPLEGAIYLGQPDCSPCTDADAQGGRMLRLFLEAQGSGVLIKLTGTVSANPITGQLTATFDNNPQLPFSDLQIQFKSGPRAPLANPSQCGTYTTTSDFQPWSAGGPDGSADATPSSSFAVTGCTPPQFAPSFSAGAANPQAGAYSPFTVTFSRQDADQTFSGLTVSLPPGVSAKLAGVPLCSDTDANAGTCPAASRVGTATTSSGPGSDPFQLSGGIYLTGPYNGAPYGLAVQVPAIAGPFNLGTVVVRQALFVNPTTAQVTVRSDPFPTILDGIPLQIRTVAALLNRPNFTINPTSCDPMSVTGTLTSTGGLTYNGSSRFQVGGCQDIGFSPKLRIGLSGKGQTKSGDHPTLTATLTDRSGQANLRSAKVTLPLSMALDPNNSQHVCSYSVAAAVHGGPVGCPTKTIVGKATANTPLLSKPLTGNVYLVQGLRCAKGNISAQGTCPDGKTTIHTLPTLLVPLRGQIALDLRAKSSVNGAGALVTTFSTIPDAPVSKFTLQITGGKKGLLVITGRGKTICGKPQVASENLGAQSGKSMVGDDTLTTPCKATKK